MTIDIFIDNFKNAVDFQQAVEIQPQTQLASLAEWDSLAALGVIVMFDMDYGVTVSGEDLKNAQTVESLFQLVSLKK
jgi:acyl carrier protein